MQGICAFCHQEKILIESHVLPAFVFRWLRRRSGAGDIRKTDTPNRRVQDGIKFPWLCGECEGLFNSYETYFANNIFHPWHDGKDQIFYESQLLKFCVSISWRVLKFARGKNPIAHYTAEQNILMDQAEACWRSFLNGEAPHPNKFEQHMVIFDFVESTNINGLPHNFNRFITGAVTLDIIGSKQSLMTFAKLGRFTIFGIIQKGSDIWIGTKVHVRHGVLKPDKFTVPKSLEHFLIERAKVVSGALEGITTKQKQKITKNVLENIDSFASSDQFAAIQADARMFGLGAVLWKDE